MSLGEIIGQTIDYNAIHEEIKDIAKAVYDKLRVGFQVMLEKVISEEFMNFLSEIAESGGDCSRNGYYARKVRTFLGDFDLQIPRARYEQFQTVLLKKYGHDIGDVHSKVINHYLGGMTENETVEAIASASGIGISREKV